MSHHHDHDHDHHHDHDQDHGHPHGHYHSHSPMTFPEKLVKLLNHWVDHNDHHAEDYQKWAKEAGQNGLNEVAELLASAAELTDAISERFREAGRKIKT